MHIYCIWTQKKLGRDATGGYFEVNYNHSGQAGSRSGPSSRRIWRLGWVRPAVWPTYASADAVAALK